MPDAVAVAVTIFSGQQPHGPDHGDEDVGGFTHVNKKLVCSGGTNPIRDCPMLINPYCLLVYYK
jgi:hypothetical protein